jgi:hypothetical protein
LRTDVASSGDRLAQRPTDEDLFDRDRKAPDLFFPLTEPPDVGGRV